MKKRRFYGFWFTVMLLLSALMLIGCPAGEQPEDEAAEEVEQPIRIADFLLVRANEYEQAKIDGMQSVAEQFNAQIDHFSCEFDTQTQINQMQDAIAMGVYDAFIVWPNDAGALLPYIREALDAGIVVIALAPLGPDTRSLEPYPEGVSSVIGTTGWSTGNWLGEAVIRASEGMESVKVAYIMGAQAFTVDQERHAGFLNAIADYPHIEIVSLLEGWYRRDTSMELMQDVFLAQPDINVVVSSGDQMTLGAWDAAAEMGIEGNVKFIGNGASKAGWQAIKEGKLFASYADIPFTQGQIAVEMAARAVRGETVERSIDLQYKRPPLPAGGPVIYYENLDEFEAQW
jgi:ABC-type sugar transport system substrate-binding protein